MTTYNVLTSFNQKYWDEVAKNNVELLDRFWPTNQHITLYHQLPTVPSGFSSKVKWNDLYQSRPDLPQFAETWKDTVKANGAGGTNFRLNAIKFCHKTFAIWHQARIQKEGWLIWLDCDAFVYKQIDETFLKTVPPDQYAVSFMGRPGKYSECGWIGFNLSHPETMKFINEWEDLYLSGKFVDLPETHDSWTFDYIRKNWNKPELFFNVNGAAITDKNPFSQSLIGTHIAHAKGAGKGKQTERLKGRLG